MANKAKMSKVMALAAKYRKGGMNPKEALKKAWKNAQRDIHAISYFCEYRKLYVVEQ